MAGGLFAVSRRRDALDARTQVSEGQTGGAGGSFPRLFAPHSIKQGNSGEAREEVEEEGAAHSVLHSTEKFSGEGCSRAAFCRAAPCNAAHEPCHRAGKLFLSIYSPPSFFLTPPTNKGRGCHSPKKTSGGIQNFFGTQSPQGAAAAFLVNLSRSICAAARRPTRRGRRDGQVLHDLAVTWKVMVVAKGYFST